MSATDGVSTAPDGDDEQQRITNAVTEIIERRAGIQHTVGMMMVIYDLDADQAFELLKWISQTNNVKLRILAEQLGSELPLVARDLTKRAAICVRQGTARPTCAGRPRTRSAQDPVLRDCDEGTQRIVRWVPSPWSSED